MKTPFLSFLAILTTVLTAGMVFLSEQNPVNAASSGCSGSLEQMRRIFIDCQPGFATPHDRITVFLRNDAPRNATWEEALDYSEAVWLFDVGAVGKPVLIINFHHQEQAQVADLFDAYNSGGTLLYKLEADVPVVTSNRGIWSVRVTAKDGWWYKKGMVNFNLDLQINGPIRSTHGSGFVYNIDKLLKTDDKIDFEIHVRDINHNGLPDYEWRQDRAPLPEDPLISGQYRTEINVNPYDNEVLMKPGDWLYWPLLSRKEWSYNKIYNQSPPPIQVDWLQGRIKQISEIVASRGNSNNYFIYSIDRVKEGAVTATNFENPFAFYDLANAKDGWPDMTVRAETTLPYELAYDLGSPYPLEIVEYAWGQTHNHSLTYQVSLAGRHPITSQINFPDFSVKAVPYDELPKWVKGQTWDAATFVQVEDQPYWTNEAVYEWNIELGNDRFKEKVVPWGYITGIINYKPTDAFKNIEKGFRGEYALDYNAHPDLYFSPIDHKLHLQGAEGGIWNVDDKSELNYSNLSGGKYIDQWVYTSKPAPGREITTTRQLNFSKPYLIYSESFPNTVVELRQIESEPALFYTAAPSTNSEWQALGSKLEQNKPLNQPGDLKTMLEQFKGPGLTINGAALSDFRKTSEDSFRFVLSLKSRFGVSGNDLLGLQNLTPGDYIVSYNGKFEIKPLTMPSLSLVFGGPIQTELEPGVLQVVVTNRGLKDLNGVTLELQLISPQGVASTVTTKTLEILAGEQTNTQVAWTPASAGSWSVKMLVKKKDGETLASAQSNFKVQASKAVPAEAVLGKSSSLLSLPFMLLLFAGFTGMGAAGFYLYGWKVPQNGEHDDG